jgi:hypothetical protein
VRDLYDSGEGVDIPVIFELPKTSATYTIPLDHFNSTTCYLFVGSDTQSIGPISTIPLQMAHSTMVPHATTITTGNTVVTQAPICTPLSSRPIPYSSWVPCSKYFYPHSYPSSIRSFWNFYSSWVQCCFRFYSDTFPGPLQRVLSAFYGRI